MSLRKGSLISHDTRTNKNKYSSIKTTFKSQVSISKGKGRGRGIGRGRGGRNNGQRDDKEDHEQ